MKNPAFRILVLLLALLMLAGCSSAPAPAPEEEATSTLDIVSDLLPDENPVTEEEPVIEDEPVTEPVSADSISADGLSYVMIYNPGIFDPDTNFTASLSTGSLASQVDVSMFRADGLEMPDEYGYLDFAASEPGSLMEEIETDPNRAEVMITPYRVGDVRDFYSLHDTELNMVVKKTFTCRYTGTYCNVWTTDLSIDPAVLAQYGETFDSEIYEETTNTFGTSRFADNGGKVNLLFTPMYEYVLGCFNSYDALFSASEVTPLDIETYCLNTDHCIVHINARALAAPDAQTTLLGTLAHEFQHSICTSSYWHALMYTNHHCETWLNEAMSGYIEENLYPGSKIGNGHMYSLFDSDRLRHGQSLYNFATTPGEDIGPYGNVYFFSEYLASLDSTGSVFHNIHDYWRMSFDTTLSEARAIVASLPTEVVAQIDASVTYPDSYTFATAEEELMSKLVLNYHLSLMNVDSSDPEAYSTLATLISKLYEDSGMTMPAPAQVITALNMLYDEIGAASIEGGGRIIVPTATTTFEIPEDADDGLVYIGLDQNFEPVGEPVFG